MPSYDLWFIKNTMNQRLIHSVYVSTRLSLWQEGLEPFIYSALYIQRII